MSFDRPLEYRIIDVAQQELNEILKWYIDNGGIVVADKFSMRIESVIDILEMVPEAGAMLDELPEVRSFRIPKFPYKLYYTINKNELEVIGLSIYHSKRDSSKLIDQLRERL
jgi:plasmid stabilization system protein ParE